jgi:hypothetical protein
LKKPFLSKKPFQAKKQFQIWLSILTWMTMAKGNKHKEGQQTNKTTKMHTPVIYTVGQ